MNLPDMNLYSTLLDSNTERHDANNVGLEIINAMCDSVSMDNICKYHDITSYRSSLPRNCHDYVNIMHINTHSLSKNNDNLISLLNSLPKLPDALCLSETWLKPNTVPLNEIEGFKSYHTHRPEGYGGVAIYMNNSFPSVLLSEYCLCDGNIELCTVKV